jgi:thiosulfate/3-mercaptopyruvate sulfurtransferase
VGGGVPPLVSTEWLAANLRRPDVVVVEVDEEAARYWAGHVPGAHNLDWLDDLHGPLGRTFVKVHDFTKVLNRLGVSNDSHVVLYGDSTNAFAASAFWLFRYYGHSRLSLLDGGRRLWLLEGRELDDAPPTPVRLAPPYQVADIDTGLRVTRDELLERFVGAPPGTAVIDCRSAQEYAGRVVEQADLPLEHQHSLGHIPGAVSLTSTELVDPVTGRLKPATLLRRVFAGRGVHDGLEVVVYCSVAERSALTWFALHELLGHARVRNYDGGWAEYGSLMDVPVAR